MTKQDFTLAEPIILALDTASKATSLALSRGGELLRSIIEPPDEKRSEMLWTEVGSLLAGLGMTIADIDVFAVCVGPGGFTGLRVGMAAIEGFSAATNKPVVGVTSLEAAAFAARPASAVCAMVNAYKGEVYSQLFSFDGDGAAVAQNDPMASTLEAALARVAGLSELVFAGDGAHAEAQAISSVAASRAEKNWTIKKPERSVAESVAGLAFLRYERREIQSAQSLRACYVRRSEAEIKLSLGLLGSKIKRSMKPELR